MNHTLKAWPEPFSDIWNGIKKCEIRRNDRNFKVNDLLLLNEYLPSGTFTGRQIDARVTHIQAGFGLPDGFVVLSIDVLWRHKGSA